MVTFESVAYLLSVTISVSTIVTIGFIGKYYKSSSKTFSKAMMLYLTLCCLPYCLLFIIATNIAAMLHFIHGSINYVAEKVINIVLEFSCQMFRNVFLFLLIERILATIFYEKYTIQNKFTFFWSLTCVTYAINFLYILLIYYYKYGPNAKLFVIAEAIYIFFIHSIIIICCISLHFLNRRMYKVTAYRISLKQRHQMLENVKFLTYMLPPIFIHTLITPIGALISGIMNSFNFTAISPSVLHIFYILSLWLICVRRAIITRENNKDVKISFVKNAFGKSLPIVVTTDNYFQGLKHQWKK